MLEYIYRFIITSDGRDIRILNTIILLSISISLVLLVVYGTFPILVNVIYNLLTN